jgi:hypothetical protein
MRSGWKPKILAGLLGVAAGFPSAEAFDLRTKFDFQANGIYRELSQQGFTQANSVLDGIFFFGTQIVASSDQFEFEIRHELRSVFGDTPSYPEGDIARLNIRSPERFMHADRTLVSTRRVEAISDIERLRASYNFSEGEVWVGRRPISLGTLTFFKVWNKFTRPVAGLFGPAIIYGSDGFGASYQSGSLSFKGISLYGPTSEDDAHLIETTLFNSFAEMRLLTGRWWNHTAVGFAFSKTVFDWMLRFESLYLNGEGASEGEVGLGFDGAINADLSLLLETYYQSIGAVDTSNYSVFEPSRFTTLRARYYSIVLLNWQLSTLWKMGIGDLLNGVDGGQIAIFKLNYSLSDDIEVLSEVNIPFASDGAEFSKRTFTFRDGNYLGSGNQFTLGLKASF